MSSHAGSVEDPQGPPHVHHMDTATAYSAAKLGMWLFLATEILLFGGLFLAFALFRWTYLPYFHQASLELDWKLGAVNTLVLLFSSLTAALAVGAAQRGDNKKVVLLVGITVLCGLGFLAIKYWEYSSKYAHGLFPGTEAWTSGQIAQQYKMYFGLYYCMTGLHALHVIIGMALLAVWPLRLARRNRFSSRYYTPVEVSALYWHLVDLIWIYLFPLLYLVG